MNAFTFFRYKACIFYDRVLANQAFIFAWDPPLWLELIIGVTRNQYFKAFFSETTVSSLKVFYKSRALKLRSFDECFGRIRWSTNRCSLTGFIVYSAGMLIKVYSPLDHSPQDLRIWMSERPHHCHALEESKKFYSEHCCNEIAYFVLQE